MSNNPSHNNPSFANQNPTPSNQNPPFSTTQNNFSYTNQNNFSSISNQNNLSNVSSFPENKQNNTTSFSSVSAVDDKQHKNQNQNSNQKQNQNTKNIFPSFSSSSTEDNTLSNTLSNNNNNKNHPPSLSYLGANSNKNTNQKQSIFYIPNINETTASNNKNTFSTTDSAEGTTANDVEQQNFYNQNNTTSNNQNQSQQEEQADEDDCYSISFSNTNHTTNNNNNTNNFSKETHSTFLEDQNKNTFKETNIQQEKNTQISVDTQNQTSTNELSQNQNQQNTNFSYSTSFSNQHSQNDIQNNNNNNQQDGQSRPRSCSVVQTSQNNNNSNNNNKNTEFSPQSRRILRRHTNDLSQEQKQQFLSQDNDQQAMILLSQASNSKTSRNENNNNNNNNNNYKTKKANASKSMTLFEQEMSDLLAEDREEDLLEFTNNNIPYQTPVSEQELVAKLLPIPRRNNSNNNNNNQPTMKSSKGKKNFGAALRQHQQTNNNNNQIVLADRLEPRIAHYTIDNMKKDEYYAVVYADERDLERGWQSVIVQIIEVKVEVTMMMMASNEDSDNVELITKSHVIMNSDEKKIKNSEAPAIFNFETNKNSNIFYNQIQKLKFKDTPHNNNNNDKNNNNNNNHSNNSKKMNEQQLQQHQNQEIKKQKQQCLWKYKNAVDTTKFPKDLSAKSDRKIERQAIINTIKDMEVNQYYRVVRSKAIANSEYEVLVGKVIHVENENKKFYFEIDNSEINLVNNNSNNKNDLLNSCNNDSNHNAMQELAEILNDQQSNTTICTINEENMYYFEITKLNDGILDGTIDINNNNNSNIQCVDYRSDSENPLFSDIKCLKDPVAFDSLVGIPTSQTNNTNYDMLIDNLTEDDIHQKFYNAKKYSFFKIILRNDDENEDYRCEVVQITEIEQIFRNNKPINKYQVQLKTIISSNNKKSIYKFPEETDNISFRKIERCDRPCECIPFFTKKNVALNQITPRHLIYVSVKVASNLDSGTNGAIGLVYVDPVTRNKKILSRYHQLTYYSNLSYSAIQAAINFINQQVKLQTSTTAKTKFINQNDQIVIITEDHNIYEIISNSKVNQIKDNSVAKSLYEGIKKTMNNETTFLGLMNNKFKGNECYKDNPAAEIAERCLNTQVNINENIYPNVFGSIPLENYRMQQEAKERKKLEQAALQAAASREAALAIMSTVELITDINIFAQICRLKARRNVPQGAQKEWASLVKMVLTKILNVKTIEERSKWLTALLLLPQFFLPKRASVIKILERMKNQVPFNINNERKQSDGNHREKKNTLDHNSKQVEMMAKDGRLKNAVKHIFQNAELDTEKEMYYSNNNNTNKNRSNEDEQQQQQQQNNESTFADRVNLLKTKFANRTPENQFKNTEPSCIPPIPAHAVLKALKQVSGSAATACDCWTRNLMMTAVTVDSSMLEQFGTVLSWIISSQSNSENENDRIHVKFDDLSMSFIRAARLVGIPKPDGGIRPIVIGSFFAKFAGAVLLLRNGYKEIPGQYAINELNGAVRVGLKTREQYQQGKVIIRIDIKNAYNLTPRKKVLECLEEDGISGEFKTYFMTMYQPSTSLITYGPNGKYEIIESDEGLRQGDAPSSYFFCLVMRRARDKIQQKYTMESGTEVSDYMDDKTISTNKEIAKEVGRYAVKCLEDEGFTVNINKSSMICKDEIPDNHNNNNNLSEDANNNNNNNNNNEIPIHNTAEPFKMLGVNITDEFEQYNKELNEKTKKFFDAIDNLNIHPEIKHAILHFCGKPRMLYYCQTTPYKFSKEVVEYFSGRMKKSFGRLIGVENINLIRNEMLHDIKGGNIPDYSSNAEALYEHARNSVLAGIKKIIPVKLTVKNNKNFTSPECSHDRQWTYYITEKVSLFSPYQYRAALAIRCGLVPDEIITYTTETTRCVCNKILHVRTELAEHICHCMKMSNYTYTHRHTFVKDEMRFTLRNYGIGSHDEPNFYNYSNEQNCRPDLTIRLQNQTVATDLTIVLPEQENDEEDDKRIGKAAKKAAEAKIKKHEAAVNEMNHVFIPFALETTGHFDKRCFDLIRMCAEDVDFHQRPMFYRDFLGGISSALAKFRAMTLLDVACRINKSFEMNMIKNVNMNNNENKM